MIRTLPHHEKRQEFMRDRFYKKHHLVILLDLLSKEIIRNIFAKIMQNMPRDFAEFAKEVHSLDANAPPPPMPKLVLIVERKLL